MIITKGLRLGMASSILSFILSVLADLIMEDTIEVSINYDLLTVAEVVLLSIGWSLISVKFNINLQYVTAYGNSEDILKYIVRQLKSELVDKHFVGNLKKEFLEDIFRPYAKEILEVKGTDYNDIIQWIMSMYEHIIDQF